MVKQEVTFGANGKTWVTDEDTRRIMGDFRDAGNNEMVAWMFQAGLAWGTIREAEEETK